MEPRFQEFILIKLFMWLLLLFFLLLLLLLFLLLTSFHDLSVFNVTVTLNEVSVQPETDAQMLSRGVSFANEPPVRGRMQTSLPKLVRDPGDTGIDRPRGM